MMDAVSLAWAVMLAVAGLALVACKATVAWRWCIEAGLKGLPKGQTSGGTAGSAGLVSDGRSQSHAGKRAGLTPRRWSGWLWSGSLCRPVVAGPEFYRAPQITEVLGGREGFGLSSRLGYWSVTSGMLPADRSGEPSVVLSW
jgi:hypothetical protein